MLLSQSFRTETFRRALTASVDSCAEKKRVPLQWCNQFSQSLEEDAGKRDMECDVNGVRLEKVASVCLPRD